MTEYSGDTIISNLTGQIDLEIELKIKSTNYLSRYSAWNFNGRIWWNDELGYWCYVPPFLDKFFVQQFGKSKAGIMECGSAELVKGSIQNFSFSFAGHEEKIVDEFGKVVKINKYP